MRPIARQSFRLAANSSHVRQSSRSRHNPTQHIRSLSRSTRCWNDTRGPNGNGLPDHDSHVNPQKDGQTTREDDQATPSQEGESAEAKASAEGRESGLKKTRRQRIIQANGMPEVPKPPPIPDWFLDHNVKLQVDSFEPNRKAKNAQVLRCVDKETGHTVFTLPWYEAWPVPGLRPGSEGEAGGAEKKQPIDEGIFDNKVDFQTTKETPKTSSTATPILTPPTGEGYEDVTPHSLLRWSLLEAETAISAGFTVAAQAQPKSSHAASKVDISLQCPDSKSHSQMDELVEDLAAITQSNLIRLDANDFGELTADYIGNGADSLGSFSSLGYDVFDGYTSSPFRTARIIEEEEDDEMDEDEEEDDESHGSSKGRSFGGMENIKKALMGHGSSLAKALGNINVTGIAIAPSSMMKTWPPNGQRPFQRAEPQGSFDALDLDTAKLGHLLDDLLNAPEKKKARSQSTKNEGLRRRLPETLLENGPAAAKKSLADSDAAHQALWRVWRSSPGCWLPDVSGLIANRIHCATELPLTLAANDEKGSSAPWTSANAASRTIVHVRDLKDISNSRIGEAIVRKLVSVASKRRLAGEEILIVGTSSQDANAMGGLFANFAQDTDNSAFRTITVPPFFSLSKAQISRFQPEDPNKAGGHAAPMDRRILEINTRHIETMLRRLRPDDATDLFSETAQKQLQLAGTPVLAQKVLPLDQVQRLVLTAIGLSKTHARSQAVNASHIGLAALVIGQADRNAREWTKFNFNLDPKKSLADGKDGPDGSSAAVKAKAKLDELAKGCNQHESRLLTGVVDAQNIKTGFGQVHAPEETIDALKTMTSLSLLRPEAFKYGVLAADRLPGLMLYGPPGTGKTLLARAVAKESKATVLEISGAQIYEKYVGEGEKMVRAVFSLAKKLSPCIVFIDEADAIFGSRSNAGNKTTHREIINQFLREWDGMGMSNVFIMVASNRPFDLDDAVLRRLPRRILVDLPVTKDRESILKIHLNDEILDDSVKLNELAEQTPLYSGSDLKNLCVSAALACVREENDLANSKQDDKDFKLPEKRTLSGRHFEKAIKEISASISEDMSSLTAIRKFDEQYGDRRGRRKKSAYGFGLGDGSVDESAARVRPPK
ncbi:unnamed protein product [Zymoseptoria tritici ST99CH_3D1]|nr:unnamed protein product [Zymoseptoria tritici ST99CH_3D1]